MVGYLKNLAIDKHLAAASVTEKKGFITLTIGLRKKKEAKGRSFQGQFRQGQQPRATGPR
jgi:hypothetical protein